jgi:phosphoribosylanthranilate isomerase
VTPPGIRVRPLCVKICGIVRPADAAAAIAAGADLIGLNFHPASPRYVSPTSAAEIVRMLPRQVLAVGVFVDPEPDVVRHAIEVAGIALLQFHGAETPEFCHRFGLPIVKALRVTGLGELLAAAAPYQGDWVLADTADPTRAGGTGRALPIEPVAPEIARRLFLAGGLTPASVAAAVRALRPLGVDVCSGVEHRPGAKDPARIRSFVHNAKTA